MKNFNDIRNSNGPPDQLKNVDYNRYLLNNFKKKEFKIDNKTPIKLIKLSNPESVQRIIQN